MSDTSRSAPAPSPASTRCEMTGEISIWEESSSRWRTFRVKDSVVKKWQLERDMRKEQADEEQRYRNEMREKMMDAPFEPETFGDPVPIDQISLLMSSVVSIALFNGDVLVYACSGIAVRHWHDNIKDYHTIFVTSARLAQKFNDNRTRDDNLRIEVHTSENKTLVGFLGLYDEKNGIAIVTSLSFECFYTMDTCNPVDLSRGTLNDELVAFGCAANGTLMKANCSHPVFENKDLVSVNCKITESGRGGPVMYFAPGGSGESAHIAGLMVESCEDKITLLPSKKLHNWLQHVLLITSKTSHFRGYSLPEGVETVIPSGFMVESKILQSLGYPLPPPLLFELNGRLAGSFEGHFGQLHYWDGYPFDFSHNYGSYPIWDQLGETLTREISGSVVSIASFKDNKRCFACTGLLITGKDLLVLTSASLVRTGDIEGEIDEKLTIKAFIPPNPPVEGILELYHLNYNIAIVRLKHGPVADPTADTCHKGILNVLELTDKNEWMETPERFVPIQGSPVLAIGRATKQSHGLLMASYGELKGKYKAVRSTSLAKKPDCQALRFSTCQIKKVGIGGPLIYLNGFLVGMNFYDGSGTTPFLPRKEILEVLGVGFDLLQSSAVRPIMMDLYFNPLKRKRTQWPVSKPYWFLGGQVHPADQLVGKVLM